MSSKFHDFSVSSSSGSTPVLDQISESHLFQKNGFTITWIEIVIRHRAFSIFNSLRLLILIFPMAFAILLLVC